MYYLCIQNSEGMHYIDTHAHLYKEYYPQNFEQTVNRAIEADVKQIILPCVTSANIPEILEAAVQYPENLYPLIGLHPTDVRKETFEEELKKLKIHLSDPRVVGIGEIGIDLYWDKETLAEQEIAFRTQLEWARDFKLPLSLHVRDAYAETFKIIGEFKKDGLKGAMHCFSGGIQEAKWAVEHGFYLGIGGVVTFKNNKLQHIILEIGLDHLVLETDAPFLAPVPFRGKTNESAYIPYIAEKVAQLFEIPVETVMQVTTANALKIFDRLK